MAPPPPGPTPLTCQIHPLLPRPTQMVDHGEQDDKVIAVHADDPAYRDFNDISELPQHRLAEIRR